MTPFQFLRFVAMTCLALALFVLGGQAWDREIESQARAAQQWQQMADQLAARQ